MTITLDGTLADWTPDDRLETPQTAVSGYELYGRIEAGAFVVALKSAVAIGPDTTFWLNTDGDTSTGYRVWGSEVGAEFNVNIGPDGIPRLYTGADGQTLVSTIDFALSPDGTVFEMRLPQAAIGSPEKISIHADVNNSVFLPANYSGPGYVVQPVATSSFDGLLTDWTEAQRLDSVATGHEGYALYGRVEPADFVIALKSDVAIGAGTTFWLNTDGNSDTGYKIWGWAGGAEYNVNIGADGIARLYTGAAGDQFVSEIDFKIAADGKSMELAVPKAALGAGVEQIAVLADINDSVFLPNNFGYGGYTLATPVVSAFDGLLTEWSQSQRLETPATQVAGYELYGTVKDGNFVIALKSDITIGNGTTFWLNTDGNTTTGHQVFGFAVGAEFNVHFGEDGRARLYTGDAGQTFVSNLDFAIGPDGKTLELAIPKGLLGNVNSVGVMADVNDAVHLPADYTYPAYTIAEAPPVMGQTSYKVAIVYSQTTAGAYFSEMAYSQLVMAAQSQAMSAGIPFDLIGEGDLTNLAKLSQYSALVFPSFRNVPANFGEIAMTLQTLIHDYGVSLIAAGDFMTNAANDASLPGNAYERMQSLFGLTRTGGDSGVDINLVTSGSNDITAGYTDGSIRNYTGASTSYFTTTPGQSGTVFAQQVVNGTTHDAVVSTTTGGRNVHFATDGMLADNNLLGQALDWATQTAGGPQVSLSMSRDSALVASRNDMDQSQETYDVDGGIYDAMLPILEQWKAQYNFVGSYYINVGLNDPDQTTDWFISSQYYNRLLDMGNEIGSHSYTHPHDTNVLLEDAITDAELDAYVAAMSGTVDPTVLAALDAMTAAEFMSRLQASLGVADPLTLSAVDKGILEASYTFQFLHARQAIEANLGIIAGGAAVPGMPENIETARQIIKYYDYLSGGASMIGAGYPGAFGFLTPNETEKVYIAPNMSFDFTLMGWLGLTPEEAKAKWLAELNDLTINADLPILVWPWHDYGPTSWDIDGNGTGSNYTLAMFTSFLEAAYAKGAEFVTLADLAARISTFEKAEMSYKVNGDTITVTATPQLGALGTFAVNLDALGTQKIASVTNWYAYDGDSVFLDADGGAFEIKLGAQQADVTRIISIGARIQLLSLTGDGVNLSFTMYGEGLVKVDLAELAGYDFNIAGAQVVNRTGDIVILKLPALGTHSVSLVRQDTINAGPTGIEVSNQAVVDEVMADRVKVADLLVLDPNIHAHLRNNIVTVSDTRFEIDPVDGALYRKAGVAFDFETEPQIPITITASDGQFAPVTRTITVQVANVNEAPTGAVLVTGETVENQTLVADLSTLGDPDGMGTPSYQWQRSSADGFVDIADATGGSYTLTDADSFTHVRVVVRYTDARGALETVTSAPTVAITDVNNAPTGSVSINGTAMENQTLTADTALLADADGLGPLSYRWQRDTGSGFVDISSATGVNYTLKDADSFASVRAVVSYTDLRGATETVFSAPTAAIADVNNGPTGAVGITGKAIQDQTLVANTTALADADGLGPLSYQWQRNTGSGFANIAGATAATYKLAGADTAAVVRVLVSYTDARGTTESVASAQTASIAAVLPVVVMTPLIEDMSRIITSADLAGAAYAGKSYSIEGLTASSGKLTANGDGTWTFLPKLNDDSEVTFSYSVKSGGVAKPVIAMLDLVGMADVIGTADADTLPGKPTSDQYHGFAGNDIMYGGAGNDIFFGGSGDDTISGEAGDDIAFGDGGMDRFIATRNDGHDIYDGGTNVDTIEFAAITAAITVNLGAGSAQSSQTGNDILKNMENVVGGKDNDIITGSSGTNVLDGGAGNDTIRGGAGNDTIYGGAGDDLLYGDAGNDKVYGGGGNDTFFATNGDGRDIYDGQAGLDTFNFAAISANVNVNLATGKATSTQTGSDTLANIENVVGGGGNDTIVGSNSANILQGGRGNDRIEGQSGRDFLTGGTGSDVFIFRNVSDSGASGSTRDVITDFTKGTDKIDLSGIDANTLKSGNQAFSLLSTASAAFTGTAGQLRFALFDEAGTATDRTVIIGDVNGDKIPDFMIELTGLIRLTPADFIL